MQGLGVAVGEDPLPFPFVAQVPLPLPVGLGEKVAYVGIAELLDFQEHFAGEPLDIVVPEGLALIEVRFMLSRAPGLLRSARAYMPRPSPCPLLGPLPVISTLTSPILARASLSGDALSWSRPVITRALSWCCAAACSCGAARGGRAQLAGEFGTGLLLTRHLGHYARSLILNFLPSRFEWRR